MLETLKQAPVTRRRAIDDDWQGGWLGNLLKEPN
jgi:hypothetical protein